MKFVMCAVAVVSMTAHEAYSSSSHALRFFGTGVGPPGFQDRVLIPLDDNANAADASAPADIGSGGFTLEVWIRGRLADNPTSHAGGDVSSASVNWIEGNIILDRDIWCGSERKFGVSLAGGFVRFGTSRGDAPSIDPADNTIEGNTQVLDNQWHHIAVVRDAATGRKHIYIDGVLDYSSAANVSQADLSYPDAGIPVTPGNCNPGQQTPYGWYLVLAAEKHDAGVAYPSFNGYLDELRIWTVARTSNEIATTYNKVLPYDSAGLAGYYRFEEGSGTNVADSSAAGSYPGQLRAGVTGNGEWVSAALNPSNTAPVTGGAAPPAPVITAPITGALYACGAPIAFSGFATNDAGILRPATALTWRLVRQHASGVETWGSPVTGVSTGLFVIPTNGFDPSADRFGIQLAVMSTNGLTSSTTHGLAPDVAVLNVSSLPAGAAMLLDGNSLATPRAYTSVVGFAHVVVAPPAVIGGTAQVFSCWSDGGPVTNAFSLPGAGKSLVAAYRASAGGLVAPVIASPSRNADYHTTSGQAYENQYDDNALCSGRDNGGVYQAGMQFALAVPSGATVLTAVIRVRATTDQAGSPPLRIVAYNVDNAAAFTNGAANPLTTHHPLIAITNVWNPPAFTNGGFYQTPDLSALVQSVINRPGWIAGNHIGFAIDGSSAVADAWRCWNNQQSGTPPQLTVEFATGALAGASDADTDGLPDAWEVEQGMNCADPADAWIDQDGDGQAAWEEYVTGHDPNDSASYFAGSIERLAVPSLRFDTVTGRIYRVERTTSLVDIAWVPAATAITGVNDVVSLNETNPAGLGVFRVIGAAE